MTIRIPLAILSALALCQVLPALQTTKPRVLVDINRTSRAPTSSYPLGVLARPDASWTTHRFQKVGKHVFFQAKTVTTGAELYYCTSQTGSARLAVDIFKGTGSSYPTDFMELGGKLYFKATDGSSGYQIYEVSVGTSGIASRKLTTLANTSSSGAIGTLIGIGNHLYFTARDSVTGNYHVHRVNVTTRKSFRYSQALKWHWASPVPLGSRIVFEGQDSQGQEAWWLDGDKLGYIRNYSGSANGRCVDPIVLGGLVYFSSFDGRWGIWKWGPKLGTKKVMDLALKYGWRHPVVLGKRLIFNGGTGEPFSVDPAAASPKVLSLPSGTNEGGMATPVVLGSKLYYYGYSSKQSYAGYYLFQTDGLTSQSISGTRAYRGGASQWIAPVLIPATKPYLLFGFRSGTSGDSLYRFDGTSFQRLRQIHYSLYRNSGTNLLTELDGKLIFRANDGRFGAEIWMSDGTGAGTKIHTNLAIETLTSSSYPKNFVRLGRRLYFTANDGVHGIELLSTDGKSAQDGPKGTSMVVDLNPGTGSSDPKLLKASEALGKILMDASNGSGRGIYVFDPLTWKATRLSGSAVPDLSTAWVHPLTGRIYALARDSKASVGAEPHVYDPTTNTFVLVADTNPGAGDGQFKTPIALGTDGSLAWRSRGYLFDSVGTAGKARRISHKGITHIGENISVKGKILFVGGDSKGVASAYALDPKTSKVQKFQTTTGTIAKVFTNPFISRDKVYYVATKGSADYLYMWDGNSASGKQLSTMPLSGLQKFRDTSRQSDVVNVPIGIDGFELIFPWTIRGLEAWKVGPKGTSRIGTQTFSSVTSATSLGGKRVACVAKTANKGNEVLVIDDTKVSMVSDPIAPGFSSGAWQASGLWAMEDSLIFSGTQRLGVGTELFSWPTGALAQSYGLSGLRTARFYASDPVMGRKLLLGTDVDANAAAVLYMLSTPALFPLKLGDSRFYLNLSNLQILISGINQGKSLLTIPVPTQPRFLGLQLEGQAVVVDMKLAFALSQAMSLSIGK